MSMASPYIIRLVNYEKYTQTCFALVYSFFTRRNQQKKKSVFKGQLTACNLHLHNMKAIELVDIEVQRNEILSTKAVKLMLKIPIVWMTGDYWVKKGKLFGFIPSSGHGSFNIDVKDVKVGVIASLGTNSNESVTIEDFEIGFRWKRSLVKLDR